MNVVLNNFCVWKQVTFLFSKCYTKILLQHSAVGHLS